MRFVCWYCLLFVAFGWLSSTSCTPAQPACGPLQPCGAGQSCVSGVCVQQGDSGPSTCPTTCAQDADCALASCQGEGRTSCRNGSCQKALTTQCPSACQQNSDCQVDGCESRTECIGGACNAPQACPATCTTDAQCQFSSCGKRNACIDGSCAEAPSYPAGPYGTEKGDTVAPTIEVSECGSGTGKESFAGLFAKTTGSVILLVGITGY
jgi:hypothetical protein